ncbi:MAG: hypothetical protein V3V17_13545 [Alphaproteobacteria bacterium]
MKRRSFLDDPKNVRRLFWGFCGACLGVALAGLAIHKHALYAWEGWFAFEALFGLIGVTAIVLGAIGLRKLVMRREDYYDR